MKVRVNNRTLRIFNGARVRDALHRYYSVKHLDRQEVEKLVVRDAYGHEIDHDAPLSDGQQIRFERE